MACGSHAGQIWYLRKLTNLFINNFRPSEDGLKLLPPLDTLLAQ
ncbi:hypothetical protein ECN1_0663 [Escherichia coli N1]|nr:hypothetical protein ECN1_0663 [Escherichia coli N1]